MIRRRIDGATPQRSVALLLGTVLCLLPGLSAPVAASDAPYIAASATTVPLLREAEPAKSDDECAALRRRIGFLRSPERKQSYERLLARQRALVAEAEKDMEKARGDARQALKADLVDLGAFAFPKLCNKNAKILKTRLAAMEKAGVPNRVLWIQETKRIEDLTEKALTIDLAVAKWTTADLPALRLKAQSAAREAESLREEAAALSKELVACGAPADVIELVALFAPPVELGNLLGNIVVRSSLAAGDYIVAKRDLDALASDLQRAVLDDNRGGMDLAGLRWNFEKYCIADLESRLALRKNAIEKDRKALNADCAAVPSSDTVKTDACRRRKTDVLRRMDEYRTDLKRLSSMKEALR